MAKATQIDLDELRKRRETLEAEIAKVREQETMEAERALRGHAEALLKEAEKMGYGSWSFDNGNLSLRISRKRSGGSNGNGQQVEVKKDDKGIGTFASAKKAAEHLKLDTKKDSAVRVLERHGYTVTKK